jgi:transcriptional regulator with XRE-family HTH domain
VDVPRILRDARRQAGLTQTALARRAGTSQATISAYESGGKQPAVDTLERLLAAAGSQLAVTARARPVVEPSADQLRDAGRTLAQVIELAEHLPARHAATLRYPRLPARAA